MESLLNRVLLLVNLGLTALKHVNPMESLLNHVAMLVTNNTPRKVNDFNHYPYPTRARARIYINSPKGECTYISVLVGRAPPPLRLGGYGGPQGARLQTWRTKSGNRNNPYFQSLALRPDGEGALHPKGRRPERAPDLDGRVLRLRAAVRAVNRAMRIHHVADPHMPRTPGHGPIETPPQGGLTEGA